MSGLGYQFQYEQLVDRITYDLEPLINVLKGEIAELELHKREMREDLDAYAEIEQSLIAENRGLKQRVDELEKVFGGPEIAEYVLLNRADERKKTAERIYNKLAERKLSAPSLEQWIKREFIF